MGGHTAQTILAAGGLHGGLKQGFSGPTNYVIELSEAFGGGTITILGVTSLADGDFIF